MQLAQTSPTLARKPPAPLVRSVPDLTPADHSAEEVAEERRWLMTLVPPFVVSAALFAAAVGSGVLWLMGPAMVLGPGLIILGFVYLALTSSRADSA